MTLSAERGMEGNSQQNSTLGCITFWTTTAYGFTRRHANNLDASNLDGSLRQVGKMRLLE